MRADGKVCQHGVLSPLRLVSEPEARCGWCGQTFTLKGFLATVHDGEGHVRVSNLLSKLHENGWRHSDVQVPR